MQIEDKAKIVAWTLAIQDLNRQIQDLQQKAQQLNNKQIKLVEEEKGEDVENIDISDISLTDFSGEIKVG